MLKRAIHATVGALAPALGISNVSDHLIWYNQHSQETNAYHTVGFFRNDIPFVMPCRRECDMLRVYNFVHEVLL